MTLTAFFLVLISVFLHAGWNFLSKSKRPSAAFYMLASVTSTLIWMPFFWFSDIDLTILPLRFWVLALVSGAFEVLYFIGLFQAYRKCDISLAYPMARALPVLLVALVTILCGLGKVPGVAALFGMAVVAGGCLLMPLKSLRDFRPGSYFNAAFGAIVLAAVGTTGYTVVDSLAMPYLIDTGMSSRLVCCGVYLFLIEILLVVGLGCYVWRHPRERVEFRRLFLKSAYPMISGAFASSAYALVLVAMGFVSNVSFIQAFRQMSLPLGVLAGIFLLKESHAPVKLAGIALVVGGLVMVSLN